MIRLSAEQLRAVRGAAGRVGGAGLAYVLMVFDREGVGAVFSNVEPGKAVTAIEGALAAARANVPVAEIGLQ